MSTNLPRALIEVSYAEYAREYQRNLPPEHYMEATSQATQRKITLESLDLLHARRPDVQVFNELLVQYPRAGRRRPGQVVPDNMVVLWHQPVRAEGSYDLPLQPCAPFWVLEYVSKGNKRKDYEDNFIRYEKELKVPYFLLFYPETRDLTLYRHTGKRYSAVPPDERGRHPIAELGLEVALLDGWVRYWLEGELLPLPADLQRALDRERRRADRERRRADRERRRADQEQHRADQEQHRADQEQQRADQEQQRADQEQHRADQERLRAEQERLRAEQERLRAEQLQAGLDRANQSQLALQQELERVRVLLGEKREAAP